VLDVLVVNAEQRFQASGRKLDLLQLMNLSPEMLIADFASVSDEKLVRINVYARYYEAGGSVNLASTVDEITAERVRKIAIKAGP
jgi:hypothetical protein